MSIQTEIPDQARLRLIYKAVSAMAAVTGLFCAIVAVLLMANFIQLRMSDPINDPTLTGMRERFSKDASNDVLRENVRALDLLARKAYFTSFHQIRRGGALLVTGAILLVVLVNVIDSIREKIPDPASCPGMDSVWSRILAQRRAIAVGGLVLIGFALAAGVASRSALSGWSRDEETGAAADAPKTAAAGNATVVTGEPSTAVVQSVATNSSDARDTAEE